MPIREPGTCEDKEEEETCGHPVRCRPCDSTHADLREPLNIRNPERAPLPEASFGAIKFIGESLDPSTEVDFLSFKQTENMLRKSQGRQEAPERGRCSTVLKLFEVMIHHAFGWWEGLHTRRFGPHETKRMMLFALECTVLVAFTESASEMLAARLPVVSPEALEVKKSLAT